MTALDLDRIKSDMAGIVGIAAAAEYSTGSLASQRLGSAWATLGANVPELVREVERLRASMLGMADGFEAHADTCRETAERIAMRALAGQLRRAVES